MARWFPTNRRSDRSPSSDRCMRWPSRARGRVSTPRMFWQIDRMFWLNEAGRYDV
jgi:hypothetical protein